MDGADRSPHQVAGPACASHRRAGGEHDQGGPRHGDFGAGRVEGDCRPGARGRRPLLERNARIGATAYGRVLLGRSLVAFDELRQGIKDIEFLGDPTAGDVRIGSTIPLAASFVSAVIDRLSRRYPRVVFHVATGEAVALRRDLSERRLDLLIVRKFGPFAEEQLSFETLYENPHVVAAGTNNPWVRRRRLGLADLVGELWALPPPDGAVGSVAVEAFRASSLPVLAPPSWLSHTRCGSIC